MQLRYVLSDRQPVRSVEVDANQSVADLLKLIQAQSRADYSPRDGLVLYRAQKYGNPDAPWLQATESDHVALYGGDKDTQAAFFVEKARLQPSQRLGDVFDLSSPTKAGVIHVVVKVPDAADLVKDAEDFRKITVFRLILLVSAIILFKTLPVLVQLASYGWKTASACHIDTTQCEKGLLGYMAFATVVVGAFAVYVLVLTIRILRAMCKQETPTASQADVNTVFVIVVLMAISAFSEDTAVAHCVSNEATDIIHYITAFLNAQTMVAVVLMGYLVEVSWQGFAASVLIMAVPIIATVSSPMKNPFAS